MIFRPLRGTFRLLTLVGLGYLASRHLQRLVDEQARAAGNDVRQAGREDMRNPPKQWDKLDEELDQSFPASDPPANY
ncbi:hypothetical protein [Halodurantibacterium flavum]|uniref:ATP synthase subunit e, mitochondrial n=1 Tax=Halodurantibacterium flavum TaxID=1382802 RepID=A0ABW4S682_9RHOB